MDGIKNIFTKLIKFECRLNL